MKKQLSLDQLRPGEQARIEGINHHSSMRRRLQELGFVSGTLVECVGQSPSGDPSAYLVRGAVIALRHCDGALIQIAPFPESEEYHGTHQ